MSQGNSDEMRSEYDMRGGVRGKYFERYKRWTSITSAVGTVDLSSVTSTGEKSKAKIILLVSHHPTHISPPPTEFGSRVAPEVSTGTNAR